MPTRYFKWETVSGVSGGYSMRHLAGKRCDELREPPAAPDRHDDVRQNNGRRLHFTSTVPYVFEPLPGTGVSSPCLDLSILQQLRQRPFFKVFTVSG